MSVRGSEQAIVTDFDEAFGQDVLKEAADKLLGGNGRESGLISGRILVGKSHLAILEGEDPAIADGDSKDGKLSASCLDLPMIKIKAARQELASNPPPKGTRPSR